MEKNQQNTAATSANSESGHQFANNQPGQQLPPNADTNENDTAGTTEEHSESSFPQGTNETLGTP